MVSSAVETSTTNAEAAQIVAKILGGSWRNPVESIRAEFSRVLSATNDLKAAKRAVDSRKKQLPGVMFSGTFSRRAGSALQTHSGLLCADLDDLGERLPEVRAEMATSPHLWGLFTSPTGNGLKALFRVPAAAETHTQSFHAVEKHVEDLTGEKIDGACKDVSRLCFVSYDPEALINLEAVELPPLPESRQETRALPASILSVSTRSQIAGELLGRIEWETDSRGFCQCPGQHMHTTGNGERDCVVHLDGAPTVSCFHDKCSGMLAGINHELRVRIGRAEKPTPAVQDSPIKVLPKPASEPDEIRGEIIAILTNEKYSAAEQRTRIAEAVVRSLTGRGQFFFHKERQDFDSAMFFDNGRKKLERIRSDAFSAWLSEWLRVNRADTLFRYIVAQIETAALSGPQTTGILPELFWASRPEAIYLSNGDGRVVKITPGDAVEVDNGTDGVLFAAGRTLTPWTLTEPKDPFVTCSLFSGASYAADHGKDLLRIWFFSLPTNPASKPPICKSGDVGSGKTRGIKGITELLGIPFVASKVEDTGENDFWTSIDAGGIFTLDNADTRCKWLADTVATAATDGCSQKRKLYTNSETVTLRARAWLGLTTANPTFASDAGLADRLLVVRMNRRTDGTSDAKLTAEIAEHRNAGLSFMVHTLAKALADSEPTPQGLNYRHPDFASFAVKIGRAIGREQEVIAALQQAEQDKSSFCVENDFIGSAVLAYMNRQRSFEGTAAGLLEKLKEVDAELADVSPKRLGKRMAALWPHFEKLFRAKKTKDRDGFTTFRLTMI